MMKLHRPVAMKFVQGFVQNDKHHWVPVIATVGAMQTNTPLRVLAIAFFNFTSVTILSKSVTQGQFDVMVPIFVRHVSDVFLCF